MNTRIFLSCLFAGCAFAPPVSAEDPAGTAGRLTGEITPKLFYFDFASGVGTDKNSVLERYEVRKGWGADTRSGLYGDLDLKLRYDAADDSRLTLERWGYGQYLHGGKARWVTERYELRGFYDYLRSTTGGTAYLFSPGQVPGGTDPSYFPPGSNNTASGYVAQFNDDSNRFLYDMSRFAYGLGFALKPGVLGESTTASIDYNGYQRYGRRLQSYVLGGSDIVGGTSSRVLQRWRGYSRNIDEINNRLKLQVTASPGGFANLNYIGIFEKFDNKAPTVTQQDIPVQPPYSVNSANPINPTRPIGYSPDSSLTSHNLRLTKALGTANLSAGYYLSELAQDSFTQPQMALGYTKGRLNTEEAFLNFDTAMTPNASLQAFLRYGNRENNSTYPVPGLISGLPGAGETLGVRINEIDSITYGLAAVVRPKGTASTVTVGWEGLDKSRDLTYHANGIVPSVSFYQEDTQSNELFVKLQSRAVKNVSFRVSTSYLWADKTGLVTEPAQAFGLKGAVTYSTEGGSVVTAYYNLRDTQNDNNTITDKNVTNPMTYAQDISNTIQSAGVSLNHQPDRSSNYQVGLQWMRQDASVLYYESSRRRFESTTTFKLRDVSGSVVDTYIFSMGGQRVVNEKLRLFGDYNFTVFDGTLASGEIASELGPIDDTLDNGWHIVTVGGVFTLAPNRELRLSYTYERYNDSAYPLLAGSVNSILAALTFKL